MVEAVADRGGELLGVLRDIGGDVERIVVAGGWSHSPTLRAAKAARFGRLDYPDVVEAGARGAALLAGVAAGVWPGVDSLPAPSSRTTASR